MGGERTYDYAVALRAVNTVDFMTAKAAEIPWDVLKRVTSQIINEVGYLNRVDNDCMSKPLEAIILELEQFGHVLEIEQENCEKEIRETD